MQELVNALTEVEKNVTFTVMKETVTTSITFNKGDVLEALSKEVTDLRKEVDSLKHIKKVFVTEETLSKDWDNEYDKRWNTC